MLMNIQGNRVGCYFVSSASPLVQKRPILATNPILCRMTFRGHESLSIMSWNVNRFENMVEIIHQIRQYNPNILLLQEIKNKASLKQLNQALKGAYPYEVFLKNTVEPYVAILSKRPPLEAPTSQRELVFGIKRDLMTYAIFKTPNQKKIAVINLYIKSLNGNAEANYQTQQEEIQQVKEQIKAIREKYPDLSYLVVAGDLNHPASQAEGQTLRQSLIEEGLVSLVPSQAVTHKNNRQESQIDIFMVSNDMAVAQLVTPIKIGPIKASDHAPLVETFYFPVNDK